jgi:methionine-gamma-lyase
LFSGDEEGYIYTRLRNPTVEAMEDAVAALEGGFKALGCGSGMAAIDLIFRTLLKSGDHVVCSKAVYGPTTTILKTLYEKFGVQATFVNASDHEQVEKAMQPNTRLLHVESPGNPTLEICDIRKLADIAHAGHAKLIVDNTFLSPVLQKPFELGADVVMHSMTKFLNGHADVVAGVVVAKNKQDYTEFRQALNHIGGVISPFNAFLVHRGIKTLHVRMQRHCENALKVARWLEAHEKVKWVRFPGLESHPQYEIAQRQQKGPGGMIAFELTGGTGAGEQLMNKVKLCLLAVSLGGVESLIQHPAGMTHAGMNKEIRESAGITDGLVRLSVGIESADDIIDDLKQALD